MSEIKWNPFEDFSLRLARRFFSSLSQQWKVRRRLPRKGRQGDIVKLRDNENLVLMEILMSLVISFDIVVEGGKADGF
jgi:hypothetical protein